MLRRGRLGRGRAVIDRGLAIGNGIGLQRVAVAVDPGDGILVDGGIELRGVGGSLGDRNNLRRPGVVERVGILRRGRLGRGIAVISRGLAICDGIGLQRVAIAVKPGDGVFVDRGFIGRLVGRVAGDVGDVRRPFVEFVSILRVSRFGRRVAVIARGRAVCHIGVFFKHAVVFIEPRHGVGVDRAAVGRGIDRVGGDVGDFRRPARKGVGILRGCLLRRIIRLHNARCRCAVIVLFTAQFSAVFVHEFHGVFVDRAAKCRGIGHVGGDVSDIRRPFVERISEFRVGCLGRGRAVILRRCAVGDVFVRFKDSAVFVFPRHGVFVFHFREGCDIGRVAGYIGDFRRPFVKFVSILRGGRFGRGCAVILRRFSVCHVGIRFKHGAVFVLPRHGVYVHRWAELRRVCLIAGNGANHRIPAVKGVGIMRVSRLGRGGAVILRRCTIGNVFVRFKHGAVPVFPGDGVFVRRGGIGRSIGLCAGNRRKRIVDSIVVVAVGPSAERVGVLHVGCLGRRCAVIGRC